MLKIFSNKLLVNKKGNNIAEISLRGFTLLELLIVIAILAILTTVVILVLNPGEYLAQARDSQRVSDLSTLHNAVALYLGTVPSAALGSCSVPYCSGGGGTLPGSIGACTVVSSTVVTGTGWVPVAFSNISGGSPISREPVDPTNTGSYTYAYQCNPAGDNTYKLAAKLESAKYKNGGAGDLESKDGGTNANAYEVGTNLSIF